MISFRWHFVTCALAAAMTLASVSGCKKNAPEKPPGARGPEAVPVTLAPVQSVRWDRAIPIVGTLYAKDEATIGAEVEGAVEKTLVEFGDRVKSGQLLAQIETTTYEAKALQAEANLARVRARFQIATQELQRVERLASANIASTADLDTATAEAAQAKAEVAAAEASAAVAKLDVERSKVHAPFEAAVAERIASAGDFVRVGTPLFRLVNDGVLKFIFQVPERNAAEVQKEQPVTFTVDAWPDKPFEGRVYLISPQVSLNSRAFNVGALVPNPDRQLKANTFARGELVLARAVPTLVVPLDAVVSFAGVLKVFVVEGTTVRSRTVQTGRVREGLQEILSGLKEGEQVVLSGHSKLFDGASVRVK